MSLNRVLLHSLSALAVLENFTAKALKAQLVLTGFDQESCTVSLYPGNFGQKFSKRNLAGLGGDLALDKISGQWSEQDVEAAWRRKEGKRRSQEMLQKSLSRADRVGASLSLLQVNFLFRHLISRSMAKSRAALNLPINRLFRLRLFLSRASYIWLKSPRISQGVAGVAATGAAAPSL